MYSYAEWHKEVNYAECHYAERHCIECRYVESQSSGLIFVSKSTSLGHLT